MGGPRRRRRRISCLLGCLAAASCTPGGPPGDGLAAPAIELPRPDLGPMEEAARREIEAQLAIAEELAMTPQSERREVAGAIGELGRLYHAYGLEDPAADCYREAERIDPSDRRWPYYRGFLHQVRGEPQEAVASFERALARSPDDPATLVRLAQSRFEAGELEVAAEIFHRVLAAHPPAAAAAQAGLGRIAAARGDPASAIERFEEALRLQPEATQLYYPLALAYRAAGRTDLAEEHLRLRGTVPVGFPDPLIEALDREASGAALHLTRAGVALSSGRPQEAIAEYRRAIATDPANATARRELGLLLAAGGDLEAARAELKEALRLEPDDAGHLEALGRVLAADGDDEAAIPLLRRATALAPGRAAALRELAAALARSGRSGEAAVAYTEALAQEPSSVAARLGRGEALLDADRPAAAAADLEAVLAAEPGNAVARLRLGEALQRLGRDEEALAHLEAAAAAAALGPRERAAALLGAGNLLAGGGDLQRAVERYRQALGLAPGLDAAALNLAGALAALGRDDEAIAQYTAILGRSPRLREARIFRGEALLRQGRAEEALTDFTALLEEQPDDEAARLGEAATLGALGRWGEARGRLEAAVERQPTSAHLAHALARLLASSPDRGERDGDRALELAFRLVAEDRSLPHAETVAMALAETGRYEEAAAWQRELLAQARAGGAAAEALAPIEANLAAYEAGLPCCAGQPSGPP